jgi:hypothetical protein
MVLACGARGRFERREAFAVRYMRTTKAGQANARGQFAAVQGSSLVNGSFGTGERCDGWARWPLGTLSSSPGVAGNCCPTKLPADRLFVTSVRTKNTRGARMGQRLIATQNAFQAAVRAHAKRAGGLFLLGVVGRLAIGILVRCGGLLLRFGVLRGGPLTPCPSPTRGEGSIRNGRGEGWTSRRSRRNFTRSCVLKSGTI